MTAPSPRKTRELHAFVIRVSKRGSGGPGHWTTEDVDKEWELKLSCHEGAKQAPWWSRAWKTEVKIRQPHNISWSSVNFNGHETK